jgi:hypothetical protein
MEKVILGLLDWVKDFIIVLLIGGTVYGVLKDFNASNCAYFIAGIVCTAVVERIIHADSDMD